MQNAHSPAEKNYFTYLIILDAHAKVLHGGMKDTLNEIRSLYWIISGRSEVRSVINKCTVCKRQSCKPFKMMPTAPLPEFRVQMRYAFENTGVDYIGPLLVNSSIGVQSKDLVKVYIALLTCASSRGIHLDIVSDAGAKAFIRCVERFVSRRGIPVLFVSDNAKCFTAKEVQKYISELGCKWNFILEKCPWWGGFWERLVKTVKQTLRKVLGKGTLTYDELLTMITRAEAVINSRPLCYQYSDQVSDVITPLHLMLGRRLLTQHESEVVVDESCLSLNKRMVHLEKIINHFVARWKHEYLTELREYHKCKSKAPSSQVRVGDVVLVEEKGIPRVKWRLGVVDNLIKSKDDFVRGCKLRIYDGKGKCIILQRPINQICYFEVSANENIRQPLGSMTENEVRSSTKSNSTRGTRPKRRAALAGELARRRNNED